MEKWTPVIIIFLGWIVAIGLLVVLELMKSISKKRR